MLLLKTHKEQQDIHKSKLCNKWVSSEDWVFTQWDGNLMHIDTTTKTWNAFLKRNPDLVKTNLHA